MPTSNTMLDHKARSDLSLGVSTPQPNSAPGVAMEHSETLLIQGVRSKGVGCRPPTLCWIIRPGQVPENCAIVARRPGRRTAILTRSYLELCHLLCERKNWQRGRKIESVQQATEASVLGQPRS